MKTNHVAPNHFSIPGVAAYRDNTLKSTTALSQSLAYLAEGFDDITHAQRVMQSIGKPNVKI